MNSAAICNVELCFLLEASSLAQAGSIILTPDLTIKMIQM